MSKKILVDIIFSAFIVLAIYYSWKRERKKNTNTKNTTQSDSGFFLSSTESDPEVFLSSPELKNLLDSYQKYTTLLKPHLSTGSISFDKSKMGGIPNLNGFDKWPQCDSCGSYLNFVIQIYRDDFPQFYFPSNKSLFQLYRCPNEDCPDGFSDKYDHKMFYFYFDLIQDVNYNLIFPKNSITCIEATVPDCYFTPKVVLDFPNYDEYTKKNVILLIISIVII